MCRYAVLMPGQLTGKTVYVAGPMAGHTDLNAPAFQAGENLAHAAGALRVLNPSGHPLDWSRRQYMVTDLAMLSQCDTILVLPGWEHSLGARAEVAFAHSCGDFLLVFARAEQLAVFQEKNAQFPRARALATALITANVAKEGSADK
jgi:hypothetical protein